MTSFENVTYIYIHVRNNDSSIVMKFKIYSEIISHQIEISLECFNHEMQLTMVELVHTKNKQKLENF